MIIFGDEMKYFGIVINETKDPDMAVTKRIRTYLESRGAECTAVKNAQELNNQVECVLVLGGDGTMLQAAGGVAGKNIPMIGVNLGTLGFLVEIELENLEEEDFQTAITFIQFLSDTRKKKKAADSKSILAEIQGMFQDNTGWNDEESMIADMAAFRKERMGL